MHQINCSDDDIDCLLAISANDLQTAFTTQTPWLNPPCRDGCQIAPAVDGKALLKNLGALGETGRRIPTLSGYCLDDGADFVMMDNSAATINTLTQN